MSCCYSRKKAITTVRNRTKKRPISRNETSSKTTNEIMLRSNEIDVIITKAEEASKSLQILLAKAKECKKMTSK